jgi:serine/threonine-protein kinase
MGFVVAARHEELGQLVALKFVLPDVADDADVAERFLREGRASARLRSEHVARVFDVGRATLAGGTAPYLVMEHLEGADLATLGRERPLGAAEAVGYVLQACDALAEAHAAGIVHRDLKPENLFVTRSPKGAPLLKILDFGISRVSEGGRARLTGTSAVMGTPYYMSPEQMQSAKNADARSDIWALGAVLYELLCGRPPFSGETIAEICTAVLTKTPEPMHALAPEVHPELARVVMRCLDKDPDKRFATAGDLGYALAPFGPPPAESSGAFAIPSWLGEGRALRAAERPGALDRTTPRAATTPHSAPAEGVGASTVPLGPGGVAAATSLASASGPWPAAAAPGVGSSTGLAWRSTLARRSGRRGVRMLVGATIAGVVAVAVALVAVRGGQGTSTGEATSAAAHATAAPEAASTGVTAPPTAAPPLRTEAATASVAVPTPSVATASAAPPLPPAPRVTAPKGPPAPPAKATMPPPKARKAKALYWTSSDAGLVRKVAR